LTHGDGWQLVAGYLSFLDDTQSDILINYHPKVAMGFHGFGEDWGFEIAG